MSNDNTVPAAMADQADLMLGKRTLADVQPGGRVRLGDALLPCPFCGNDAEFVPYKNNGLTLKCKSMGCIQRHQRTLRYGIDWLRTSMTEHWNARVLSAQPTPGGQGDALELLEAYDQAVEDLSTERSDGWNEDNRRPQLEADVAELRAELVAALASRQPVGEPVGYFDPDVLAHLTEGLIDPVGVLRRKPNGTSNVPLYLHPSPEAYSQLTTAVESLIGVIDGVGVSFKNGVTDPNGTVDEGEVYAGRALEAVERALQRIRSEGFQHRSPAQAVDLGQFRAKVAELLRGEFDLEVADPEDHRHDDGSAEAGRIASRIVALIDSKAVGK